ncbi:D-sedoheptulose-7-phosphate isomerase [Pseudohongiella spirulinae]|uniref:DnaA initiator-associating protein DiaA n=1 Tax=Pseudohongiella spirulinae TaxID=1249552 RepID=A0A0S2KG65_9GAMM|nr:SIS domain-containing protein [Pseudohongiella spirulinae]ALO46946.1 DnaA initiator-associating protein DiaA [Pseudohongiella spirulinae]
MNLAERIEQQFQQCVDNIRDTRPLVGDSLLLAADTICAALLQGGKVMSCGNGGSAALAQYFALLLQNRYQRERPGLPAVALSADNVLVSGVAAEDAYKNVYANSLRTLGQATDCLVVFCADRDAANLREAVRAANDRDIPVILIDNEQCADLQSELNSKTIIVRTPGSHRDRNQETHTLLVHCLCDLIDIQIFGEEL